MDGDWEHGAMNAGVEGVRIVEEYTGLLLRPRSALALFKGLVADVAPAIRVIDEAMLAVLVRQFKTWFRMRS